MFSRYTFFGGRRRGPRRDGDATAVYVDRISGGIASLVLLIFLFHCLDAVFTLAHLSRGGKELNPFMEFLIRIGPGAFIGVKLGLAAIGLTFLAVHKNFPRVRAGILFLFLLYAGVVAYHFVLILQS
jgi:hypothetical protein